MHPYQLNVFKQMDKNEEWEHNGKKIIYFHNHIGRKSVAFTRYPDTSIIPEFLAHCKKTKFLPIIISDTKLHDLPCEEHYTQIIDLTKPFDEQVNRNVRRNIRLTEQAGFTIRTTNEWTTFNEIHNRMLTRKNIPFNPEKRSAIFKELEKEDGKTTTLYGAYQNNKLVAGVVLVYCDGIGAYVKIASDDTEINPSSLILKTICEQEKKFTKLDLLLPPDVDQKSTEIKNIVKFKTQFGKRETMYVHYHPAIYYGRKIKHAWRAALRSLVGRLRGNHASQGNSVNGQPNTT